MGGGDVRRGGAGPGGRGAEAHDPGDRRQEPVDAAVPGTTRASCPERRRPANPAAEPAVRASAATGSRAWPGAGSCGRRDAGDARL